MPVRWHYFVGAIVLFALSVAAFVWLKPSGDAPSAPGAASSPATQQGGPYFNGLRLAPSIVLLVGGIVLLYLGGRTQAEKRGYNL